MRKFISRLLEPKDNAPEAAFLLSELLGAKISRSTLEKEIKGHPDYPTLLSISDVLNSYGIENLTARFDKEKLPEIPTPFITQISANEQISQFTVVAEIDEKNARYYDPISQTWSTVTLEIFAKRSSDNILMAEVDVPVKEKDYEAKISEEKRVQLSQNLMMISMPVLLLLTGLFAFSSIGVAALLPMLYGMLTLTGFAVTVLLLWYEVDQSNEFLRDICTYGKKANCGAILQSKDAKIFGVSWSTIGFTYFAGNLIMLLFSGLTNVAILGMLTWLTLAATPYVFYSVYYQWRVARQWCVLCLSVQAVLVLQCAITFIAGWHHITNLLNATSFNIFLLSAVAFVIPFIAVSLLIPALLKAKQSGQLTQELHQLKHNPEIFTAILEKQKTIEYSSTGLGITMGNPNGKVKITKVCNPYCGPCARAHAPIEHLLHINPELQVQIIFTASNDDNDAKSHPVRHLLAIDQKEDSHLTQQALNDWYLADEKDYNAFAQKYPMNGELKKQGEKIEAMLDWCNKTEIQYTPTFFINGYQLPSNYSVNDLKYFLSV